MVRDTTALGRPGWQLLPDGWEAHHTPVAAQQMTGTCHIWSGPATRTTDPTTGEVVWGYGTRLTTGPVPVRLQQLVTDSDQPAGGQQVTTHRYRATLSRPTDSPSTQWILEVVTSSDASLTGLHLQVIDILRGTLRWQRDLIATDNLG